MHVIGEIEGRNCVIMDDMIDTAGTLVKAADVLKERGAKKVFAYCTHAVFSGPAIERIQARSSTRSSSPTRFRSPPTARSAPRCASSRWLSCSRRRSAASRRRVGHVPLRRTEQ
jgi:ribose-phosphate pyrophosphokinase